MKIIDLLNKISNGEEVPKKIKYDNLIFKFNAKEKTFENNDSDLSEFMIFDNTSLNEEVEILEEEKKIPEKLDMVLLGQCDNWMQKYNKDTQKMENTHIELNPYVIDTIRENTLEIQHKFNEIIDYLKSKGE